jgi:hypothetical protein
MRFTARSINPKNVRNAKINKIVSKHFRAKHKGA